MDISLRRLRGAVLSLLLLLPLAACGSDGGSGDQVPGVTDTTILIGSHQPLTGPAAPGYSKGAQAANAYFSYVNDHGGVHGRKIQYKYLDDAYNPATTQQVVRQLVLQDKVFAIVAGLGTPTHTGVVDFLNADKVPDLFVQSGSRTWNQPAKYPYTFGWAPNYTIEGKILADYAQRTHPGQKICDLRQSDDFGASHLAGVQQILGDGGLAQTQDYNPTVPDLAPQIGAFKAAGCQVVISAAIPAFSARALTESARQGFHPAWLWSYTSNTPATLNTLLGAQKDLLNGVTTTQWSQLEAADPNPWKQLFQKINDQYNKGATYDSIVGAGMLVAYDFVQILEQNGRNLTRDSLIATTERGALKDAAFGPYHYSKTDHSGMAGVKMVDLVQQSYLTPTYTTDEAKAPVTEYNGPTYTPPASGIPSG